MRAIDQLDGAIVTALAAHVDVHKRWIDAQFRFSALAGTAALIPFAGTTRLDMLLRQIESEQLAAGIETQTGAGFVFDLAVTLSEAWVLRAYEMVRGALEVVKKRGAEAPAKLLALHDRLALVRMPIAKLEIRSANKHKGEIVLVREGGEDPRAYIDNGSYIVPRGICGQSGAVMWWPVDLKSGQSIEICRRDLSDEFLALFD